MTEYEINKAVVEKLGVKYGIMGYAGDGQRLFVIGKKVFVIDSIPVTTHSRRGILC